MDWKKAEEKLNFMDRLAGDKVVWIIVLFLCLISMVSLFSSTSQLATGANTRIDIIRTHLLTVAACLLAMTGIYKINNINVFKWCSKWGFLFSFGLLAFLDLHLSIGPVKAGEINHAWRVLTVGHFQIHVFEIVKVAMVMYLAWAIETYKKGEFKLLDKLSEIEHLEFLAEDKWKKILAIYIPILIICVASLPGSNSNAVFIAAIMFLTILIAGMPFKDVFLIGILVAMLFGCCVSLYFASDKTMFKRVGTLVSRLQTGSDDEAKFINAKKGTKDYYDCLDKIRQPVGAKLAIKRGGLLGKGPGNSTQKYVVPVIYEDYIYSFIIEEYGLIGGIFVIFLYISLLARGSIISRHCDDYYAKCTVAGLCVMITAQAMMHIMVNCDVGPLTGQTLPMISYGTSSFVCFSIAFGVILSISRMATKKIEREAAKVDPLLVIGEDEVKSAMDDLNAYETDELNENEL